MKVNAEDYRKINEAILHHLEVAGMHVSDVTNMCQAWQMLYAANDSNRIRLNQLYKEYNDAHLETVLRRIFVNMKEAR